MEQEAYLKDSRLVIVTGNYGSGKTEFSVNYVQHLASLNKSVSIVDLDVVNPYFRCREVRETLEAKGINIIAPQGDKTFSDLPIILPEVKGVIQDKNHVALLDVGGDPEGARVLGSFAPSFAGLEDDYELLFVINISRPFAGDKENVLKILRAVEFSSKLKVTGIVSNSHLIDETTEETIKEGHRVATEVVEELGLQFKCIAAHRKFEKAFGDNYQGVPMFYMERMMLPPWKMEDTVGSQKFSLKNVQIKI